ncbi:ribonuclease H-like YkuK family protein (plasmid) [Pontibacillus sp. ALD_SL1]|uniref:ribonuclease H-like YkuK family protein n=1 Tax=Pontibacillus sp. ALD_SL1 TaxID=2777185 RepID=UPI001A95C63F|nr:ribonuclease H-like YkuK family protein [Pontibacillus sp. ALD_SL1]QST02023.1 ribonuclease H-like YkuK family protein [Pontibacillus sp. ALD_SL1]
MASVQFYNLTRDCMSFEDVVTHIVAFMKKDPTGEYKLMVGTDSQVHTHNTRFITGVVIQRIGKGAWACVRKVNVPRQMRALHERISHETSLTEEVAGLFTEEIKEQLIAIVLPHIYKGASFSIEGHIDIGEGKRNKTRVFVNEMVGRIESLGMEPVIKPEAIVASSYANKYTK